MPNLTKHLSFLSVKSSKSNNPLFVFLPGMDGTGQLLLNQLDELKNIFDIRCLSIPSNDLTNWQGLVEQTASLIKVERKMFSKRLIYLCGESFGGCLALKLAALFPSLYDRLILVNPASSVSRLPWMGWGASITKWLPNSLYQISTIGLLPFLIVPQRVSRRSCQVLVKAMRSVTPESVAWRLSLLNHFTLDEVHLQQIKKPALILASGSDRLLPSEEEANRLTSYLPNAQKILLPKSGHACLLETEVRLRDILLSQGFYDN